MRALLLADAPGALARACATAGLELVDGRIARPIPLEWEIRRRIDVFYGQLRGHSASGLYDAVMREVERPLIASVLARARGVRADAARVLGIDRGTLSRRIRTLRIR